MPETQILVLGVWRLAERDGDRSLVGRSVQLDRGMLTEIEQIAAVIHAPRSIVIRDLLARGLRDYQREQELVELFRGESVVNTTRAAP